MGITIDRATVQDVDTLLKLYFTVYGNTYPIRIGTDREIMTAAIGSDSFIWLVARDSAKKQIVGSSVIEIDRANRIGKLEAVVVHPDYRGKDIATQMIRAGTAEVLGPGGPVNSVYTTTRTVSVAPQIMVLKDGFLPLGIFPNAHRLREYETTTLLAKFREGVLERRTGSPTVPQKLMPIMEAMNGILRQRKFSAPAPIAAAPQPAAPSKGGRLEFEFIYAPSYVMQRFQAEFFDEYDRFFPFHQPNTIIASTNGEVQIYAHLSRQDGYCPIVTLNVPVHTLAGRIGDLLNPLTEQGISYVEVLIGLDRTQSIETLLEAQFLPSAVYPAMQESNGKLSDFVIMSRTLKPLNFRGMAIDRSFKPYIDQYVDLWKGMHLDVLDVFNDYG